MEKQDEELMMEYQSGSQQAFDALFTRYKQPVFNFSLRMLGNRADAEDATADVFYTLFSRRYTPHPEAKFSTWLYTVARNSCIDKIRKRKRSVSMWFKKEGDGFAQWDIPDRKAATDAELLKQEIEKRVKQAINQLPQNQREVLILREYEKLSYGEISVVLNCSLENVKILIYRARENLRVQLESFRKEEE